MSISCYISRIDLHIFRLVYNVLLSIFQDSKIMIIEKVKIQCSDNFKLSASLYQPKSAKAAVMIAPATGIKKEFYNSFASYLCGHGYLVITFDNRGIGESKEQPHNQNINNFNASLINWGRLDMTAVLEYLKQLYPNYQYHLIGHSAGAQLAGLMKNANELTSMCCYGGSSGSLKYSKYPFKIKSYFFLNIFIPLSNFFFGETRSQYVGMGEPLPKLVAQQWSKWCNGNGYVKVDLDTTIQKHLYYELSIPALWIHATDDEIANINNVNDMLSVYPNLDAKILTLDPNKLGCTHIGHMTFFSSKNKKLWSYALNWLEQYTKH